MFCALERFSHLAEEESQPEDARAVVMGELCLELLGNWRLGEGWRWGRQTAGAGSFCRGLAVTRKP